MPRLKFIFQVNSFIFRTNFSELGFFARKATKRIDQLKNNLNSETISFFTNQSYGFANLTTHVQDITNLFDPTISDSESSNYGISENFLKEYLKKEILGELQKYCKK